MLGDSVQSKTATPAPSDLTDIADRTTLQRVIEAFEAQTGVPIIVVDTDGIVWTDSSNSQPQTIDPQTSRLRWVHCMQQLAHDPTMPRVQAIDDDRIREAYAPIIVGNRLLGSYICGPVQIIEKEPSLPPASSIPAMTSAQFDRIASLLQAIASMQSSYGQRLAEQHATYLPCANASTDLHCLLNAMDDLVFIKDDQHRWVLVNDALCRFMRRRREEIIGKSDFDFFPEEEATEFWRMDDEVFRTGKPNINEERLTDGSGITHVISTKKTLLEGSDGKRFLIGVIRDFTERHQEEVELTRHREHLEELVAERTMELSSANRMLQLEIDERLRAEAEKREMQAQIVHQQKLEAIGRLTGGIAHDFNNLLTGVFGHISFALRDETMDPHARESLLLVREAATRAADLIKQLLAFSRKQIIEPRIVDLNALIEKLRRLLDRVLGEDVKLITRYDAHLGNVRVDPVQIEQVIVNLAINARDAMPKGGTLRIETMNRRIRDVGLRDDESMPPGNYAVLVVSDTGVGMDEETKARIFEPFFSTKAKGQGTGLGLATVYGIVKQHRGTIFVTSSVGQGSIFQVLLPCIDAPHEPVFDPSAETILGGTETILLVEDEQVVRQATEGMLEQLGYHVIVAQDGPHALQASEQYQGIIHLLMTDVIMPGMNGKELAELLLQARPNLRVLFTSGYTDDVIVHHGVLDNGVSFISKPFDSAELAGRVRKALES
ncbi:MAG TPA: response regulator [Polyangiaceae bacterium]|nr:MAG: Blue-light-activated protein [Deltaproteobacteria bacterium ADurb.Bin207]HNS99080.1 response regulator [Polyangiaceae bacterium]